MADIEIKVSEQFLKKTLDSSSQALVGKLLKRFEIHEDKNVVKAESKELIYEHFRQLKELLLAFDKGRVSWKFNAKTEDKHPPTTIPVFTQAE
jgi:hypothetical protein